MSFWQQLKNLMQFQQNKPQFSLGNKSWKREALPETNDQTKLFANLAKNKAVLENVFEVPTNKDIIMREFTIANINKKAMLVFIDGLTSRETQNLAILEPLMVFSSINSRFIKNSIEYCLKLLLPTNDAKPMDNFHDVINGILDGTSALLIDGCKEALIIETRGWEHRTIGKPAIEPTVRGPQEAFSEHFRTNTACVRRYLKDPKLITEIFRVGKRSNTLLAVFYIKDITNPRLVEEIKYRIQSISESIDYVSDSGTLEELLEDRPNSLFPQMLSTERPDRLASFIREGQVGMILDNSPFSLVAPTNFTIFIHTAEDYYLRWPYSNFLRVLRAFAIFISFMLPAFYLAVVNYHQEMIPTDLLIAMSAAREAVPFPTIFEIIIMEFSFEFIREAGIRIPSVIGATIGIVGALILGQAAVAAFIVSPILIVIVAITALASFVVPNYNASFTVRILRFIFIVLAGFLGLFGIAFGIFLIILHLASLNSFGVPFLAPIAPYHGQNKDRVLRPKNFNQQDRPLALRPLDYIRQKINPRRWDEGPLSKNEPKR